MSKKRFGKGLSDSQVGFLLIVPGLALFVGIILYPFINAIFMSFTNKSLLYPTNKFIGIANYVKVFSDPYFLKTILVTVTFVFFCNSYSFYSWPDMGYSFKSRI